MWAKYDGDSNRLIEDIKSALLYYKGSKFHNSRTFGAGNIFWLLEGDRVEVAAANWQGDTARQNEVARTIVAQVSEGIPKWGTDRILTGMELSFYKRRVPRLYENQHPDCPSIEYLKQYFPEILIGNSNESN